MTNPVLAGKRVLVVEDEALIAMLAEEMIAELGCIVHATAPTIPKALVLAEAGGFDVAVLDVNVGRERVFAVADVLAAKGIPFAFASGYGAQGIEPPHLGRPLIGKPYSTTDLERALVAALSG